MAKPGSDAARQISGNAEDLSRLRMSDEEAQLATEALEIARGLRCSGCGRRVKRGFHFFSISVKDKKPLMRMVACSRDDCGFAAACREGGTYVEQVEFAWLDAAGADAPPARQIVEQNERVARAATALGDGAKP